MLLKAKDDMDFINLVAEEVGKKFPTYREPYIERELSVLSPFTY